MAIVVQFTVGDTGAPADGSINYFSAALAGEKIKVFREGLYQYRSGVNFIIVSGSGTVTFIPSMYNGERIRIQTI